MTEPVASRDWHTRARVRILKTTHKHSPDNWSGHTFQAGEELEMVQWGRAGRPVTRDSWWTSYDIDGALILNTDEVEVIRIIEETSPESED